MGVGGWTGGGEKRGKLDKWGKWGWAVKNSSTVGILSSRVNEVSSFPERLPADCCWRTVVSSLSSLEGKKSDGGWFLRVLDGDSGCEGSHQLF